MTANPNQHWGAENHTRVSRFVTRIVDLKVHVGRLHDDCRVQRVIPTSLRPGAGCSKPG